MGKLNKILELLLNQIEKNNTADELKNPDLMDVLWSKANFKSTCNANAASKDGELINYLKKGGVQNKIMKCGTRRSNS